MPNAWIEHVRDYAKSHNLSYACALSKPDCKATYKKPPVVKEYKKKMVIEVKPKVKKAKEETFEITPVKKAKAAKAVITPVKEEMIEITPVKKPKAAKPAKAVNPELESIKNNLSSIFLQQKGLLYSANQKQKKDNLKEADKIVQKWVKEFNGDFAKINIAYKKYVIDFLHN
jgi:hypothetical protein